MTFYRHVMSGPGPEGDIWDATLHSTSTQALAAVHTAFAAAGAAILGDDGIGPMWPTNQSCTSLSTFQLDAAGRNVAVASTAVSLIGTGEGSTLPQRVSVVVSLRTATPTRAGRGRFYLPPTDTSHLATNGELASADALTLSSAIAGALSTMAATATPVVYHRGQDLGTAITTVGINTVWGTQRRRTNKVANDYQFTNL